MVNDYVLSNQLKSSTGSQLNDYLKSTDLSMEIVDYVVLQTPAINITTGAASTYSLICEVESNVAVYPSPKNLLLYRTFSTISHRKQVKEIDYNYAPVDYKVLDSVKPPENYRELARLEEKMDQEEVIREGHNPAVVQTEGFDDHEPLVKFRKDVKDGKDIELKRGVSEDLQFSCLVGSRSIAGISYLVQHYAEQLVAYGVKLPMLVSSEMTAGLRTGFAIARDIITSISSHANTAKFDSMLKAKYDKQPKEAKEETKLASVMRSAKKFLKKDIALPKPRKVREFKPSLAGQVITGKLDFDKLDAKDKPVVIEALREYVSQQDTEDKRKKKAAQLARIALILE